MVTQTKSNKFPLWYHTRGGWTKKIRGKFHYFGHDRDAALKEYVRNRDDLEAGRSPRPKVENGITLRELCNIYLTARRRDVDTGELSARTWGDYYKNCERLILAFGAARRIDDLRPHDFGNLRANVAKKLGPISIGKVIQLTKTIFLYAYESELIDRPVRYGNQFERPPKRIIRLARAKAGVKLIEPTDARKMIEEADPQLRAMILLGLNCGFGQGDCSGLDRSQIATSGWIDYPRPKTGIARRCPLWPETVVALEAANKVRPNARDEVDQDAVFLTRQGVRWVRWNDPGENKVGTRRDSAAEAFRRLVKELGVNVRSGPYTLRHTFRTVADEVHDRAAIDLIMGHGDHTMAATYRERIDDSRLKTVVNHVHNWLFCKRMNSDSGRSSKIPLPGHRE
jgi:integrase